MAATRPDVLDHIGDPPASPTDPRRPGQRRDGNGEFRVVVGKCRLQIVSDGEGTEHLARKHPR
jgi:hypothetical protein